MTCFHFQPVQITPWYKNLQTGSFHKILLLKGHLRYKLLTLIPPFFSQNKGTFNKTTNHPLETRYRTLI